jgi:hypothetical protein
MLAGSLHDELYHQQTTKQYRHHEARESQASPDFFPVLIPRRTSSREVCATPGVDGYEVIRQSELDCGVEEGSQAAMSEKMRLKLAPILPISPVQGPSFTPHYGTNG